MLSQLEVVSSGGSGIQMSHLAGATTAMDITIDGLKVDTVANSAINATGANANNFNLRLTDGNLSNDVAVALTGAGHFGLLVDNTDINVSNNDVAFSLTQTGGAKNADLTFRNGNSFNTNNAQALVINSSGATGKTVNVLVEDSTFANNSATLATADITAQQTSLMNLTVQGNTFTNSAGTGINYNNTANGASANITLNLGGTAADANTVLGGLKEYDLHALAGSTFTLVDKTNTLNNTRNPGGTVVTDPNAAAFGDTSTPPPLPVVP
jgi:hypothetical protein